MLGYENFREVDELCSGFLSILSIARNHVMPVGCPLSDRQTMFRLQLDNGLRHNRHRKQQTRRHRLEYPNTRHFDYLIETYLGPDPHFRSPVNHGLPHFSQIGGFDAMLLLAANIGNYDTVRRYSLTPYA